MTHTEIIVIGGGLAGAEAAWQAAERGARVRLYEMRPLRQTPAHKTDRLAELVCSNSLRAADPLSAAGLLKEELRRLGSLILRAADATALPAGGALAVDREAFAARVTETILRHPRIAVHREEVTEIPAEGPVIVATGPLTSDALARALRSFTQKEALYFYDAISPIVEAESIDATKTYRASRYGKGGEDYINCPLTEADYGRFYDALTAAEKVPYHSFEREIFFEGCLPIEEMASRGKETLRFGPMKPVGLPDPRTGRIPHAVVQLRQDNAAASLYNLVGFQSKLKWPEQQRVFRLIPGLELAEFVRYGSLHRNTYVNAPMVLRPTLQCRKRSDLFLAGQITGVEGYVESAATGLLAGVNAARLAAGETPCAPPPTTALGAILRYVTTAEAKGFQPMNISFGLLPPLPRPVRQKEAKRLQIVERARRALEDWMEAEGVYAYSR